MSPRELGVDAALILDTSHEAFVAMGVDGRIVAWNRAAEELFGHARDEAIGRELAEVVVPPHLREAHRNGLARYLETGEGPVLESRLELPALHADGRLLDVEITISAVTAERGQFFHAFVHDISERAARDRMRATQLRVSERLAIAASDDDLRLALEMVCRAGEWSCGTIWMAGDDSDMLHSPIAWSHPGRDLALFEAAGRSACFYRGRGLPGIVWETGEPVWHWPHLEPEDFPRRAAAERVGVRNGLAIPLRAGSAVVAVLELFGDEDTLPGSEQVALLDVIGPLLGEHLARRRAERHVGEQKEAFVATVSHELRTPLTAIVAAAQTAIDYGDRLDETRQREFLELILGQSRRLMQMVQDLLRMSALQSRAILPTLDDVELHEAAAGALHELGLDDVATVRPPADGPSLARADADLFKQVVVNLVQNARRYGEPPVLVEFERSRDGERICMHVSDLGPGVEDEFVPQLFEKFSRGAAGASQPGTGLGLAIVLEIVRAMGGRVRHEHNEPRGARFVVELPRA